MSSTLARSEGPADAELISAVRGGDVAAYGQLFQRHLEAANRLARQLTSHGDADDLVSEAFTKVLRVLQRGGGPDVAFRAYLLTAVRHVHLDRVRAASHLHPTGDMTPFDPGVPFEDTAVAAFENRAAARAFASLPERWQLVLWHTEVEGQKPAEIAPLLGLSPNSVSALAYRAREGLRQAFLTQHGRELEGDTCRWTHQNLGAYVRGGVSRRDGAKVEAHLQECRPCLAIYLELTEVNSKLSGILAPLLLGTAGAAYLSSSLGAGQLGVLVLAGRGRDWLLAHGMAAGATAAVATTVAAVTTASLLTGGATPVQPRADVPGPTPTAAPAPVVVSARAALRAAPVPAPVVEPAATATATATATTAPPPSATAGTTAPVTATPKPSATPEAPAPAAPPPQPPPIGEQPSTPPSTTPPPETPAQPPPPDGRYDIALAASATQDGQVWTLAFTVAGVPDGAGVEVTVTGENLDVQATIGGSCDVDQAADTARCDVATDGVLELKAQVQDVTLAWSARAAVSTAPGGDRDGDNDGVVLGGAATAASLTAPPAAGPAPRR